MSERSIYFRDQADKCQQHANMVGDARTREDVHFNQERWASGGQRDLEQDGAESGIGDQDGLDEQIGRQDWQPTFFV